ncbi:ParB N-terminal domain-containing protein [Enterobacteriaceae bacterium YMB-R22]|jgi:ParB family protein of integrating conjugative element (PFGI_1 class)|uniref:ParB family protein n=1 Tax=Tenebrionicola larvae TaxID=2815733 RepID=UPI0020125CA3|nr:ParB family protein [Tenebrionicola larvae]MBV4413499.1 ParB N-terminal domain-containing protein [Tenebrionicola larvae]
MTSNKRQALGDMLLQRGRSPATGVVAALPVNEMPMVLTLDQLRPNPDNPRTTRNPKYDDIKASIRARGLDSVPKVTRNPDSADDVYIFSDGGNTRYSILSELWEETQDERFRRIQCIFKPWPGRLKCVIGHLAENDVRGDLLFIERALGIAKAKAIYQEETGKTVSQRELELFLRKEGYPVSQSNISRMEYTLEHLYPYMPCLFNSGIGRPQVAQLVTLRGAALKAWNVFTVDFPASASFSEVFGTVCRSLDNPEHYTFEALKDELISALLQAIPAPGITYDRWLIELDPNEQNRRKLFGEPAPLPQHVVDADNNADASGEQVTPATIPDFPVSIPPDANNPANEKPFAAIRQPDAIISLPDKPAPENLAVSQEPVARERKEEEQLDLYEEHSELVPIVTLSVVSDATTVEQHEERSASPEDKSAESTISFANIGLEPVTDIWQISALQDDSEHLQDAAFRLAFELAEVLEAEQELIEDNAPGSVGYRLEVNVQQASPITRLLAGLAGDVDASLTAMDLANIVFGTGRPEDWPLLDDVQTVKLLRLIRVIRRLRELQRQLPLPTKGGVV